MFSSLSHFIARRFSRGKQRNKMVSFISMSSTIGIAVGVAVIIIGLSAMNGFERELNNRVLSVISHGEFEGVRGPLVEWQQVVTQAEKHPKIEAAAPYVKLTALAEKGTQLKAIEVRGIDPEQEGRVSSLSDFIDPSVWASFKAGEQQAILGKGVAVIIIGLSAMNGFERELNNRVLSVISHGEFEGVRGPLVEWQQVVTQAEKHPKIEAAAPYVKLTALAEKGTQLKAIEVRGIDPEQEGRVSSLSDFIDPSVWASFKAGEQQAILGKGVADLLGVKKGDYLTLMIPTGGATTKVQAPKRVRVKVAGLLTLNGQIDHNLALIPLADAQSYAKLGQGVSGVAVKVTDVLEATQIVREAGNTLSVYVYLRSWQQKYGFLYRDIQLVRTIMYLVMVLVIGVASFNIVSTLMMAVKDRAAEIAILRTMGASDGLVKRIFIWQGVFSGAFGSIVGSIIGVLVALNLTPMISALENLIGHKFLSGDIYFVDFLPSQIEPLDVAVVSITAIVLSLLATWYPASRASKLNPAAVLSSK